MVRGYDAAIVPAVCNVWLRAREAGALQKQQLKKAQQAELGMQTNRFSVVAHYTRDLVYERLGPAVLRELESKSPKDERGYRPNRLHQWLTEDIGDPMLAPKRGDTLQLPFGPSDASGSAQPSEQFVFVCGPTRLRPAPFRPYARARPPPRSCPRRSASPRSRPSRVLT